MGVLIVAGFAFLGVELYNRASSPERRADIDRSGLPERPDLALPAGSRFGEITVAGNRVVFRASLPDGTERLYLLDPRTGAIAPVAVTGMQMGTPPAPAQ